MLYVYLLIVSDSAFCKSDKIQNNNTLKYIYKNNSVRVADVFDEYTLIKCDSPYDGLENFTPPNRKLSEELSIKTDIRFENCEIPNNFKISKFMNDLGMIVNKLTFEQIFSLKR